MRHHRITAFFLSIFLLFNTTLSAFAEKAFIAETSSTGSLQKHTITITAGDGTGKPMPLSSERTTMEDLGSYLKNAEGVVETQVQSVYYPNQKLVSLSLADTSFSFSPLMLDEYEPQALETESPEAAETVDPSSSPEPSESPEPSVEPESTDAEPGETSATETPSPTETSTLSIGYGKTIQGGTLYLAPSGDETLGILKSNVVLYIVSISGKHRAEIIFDTSNGLIKGFYPIKHLQNLNESEKNQAIAAAKSQPETAAYDAHPLPRTEGYTPDETPIPIESLPASNTPITNTPEQTEATSAPTEPPQQTTESSPSGEQDSTSEPHNESEQPGENTGASLLPKLLQELIPSAYAES